jgi:hypothetical protein
MQKKQRFKTLYVLFSLFFCFLIRKTILSHFWKNNKDNGKKLWLTLSLQSWQYANEKTLNKLLNKSLRPNSPDIYGQLRLLYI